MLIRSVRGFIYTLVLCFVFLSIWSCSNGLDVHAFMLWNKDNPIEDHYENNGVSVKMKYIPNAVMALNDIGSEYLELSRDSVLGLVDYYNEGSYFVLSFKSLDQRTPALKVNAASMEQYYSRLKYLTAGVPKDLKLISGNDTVNVSHHVFERQFGIGPTEQVLLHFPTDIRKLETFKITYSGLFAKEKTFFQFYSKEINEIPKLEI